MIFTKYGMRFRVSPSGGLDVEIDDTWIRYGWDCYGVEPGEWLDYEFGVTR